MKWLRLGAGRSARTLIFTHATGLNASAYRPLLETLDFDGTVLAPSLRGHGGTTLPADPRKIRSFWTFAKDLLADIETFGDLGELTLAGHSAGSVTSVLVARQLRPQSLILVEPLGLPRTVALMARTPLKRFTVDRTPIALNAAKRRAQFPSRDDAREAYLSKAFFKTWDPRALDGYLDEGLVDDPEGGVRLSCEPAWESAVFGAQAAGFWPHLHHVRRKGVPVHGLVASRHSTFPGFARPGFKRSGAKLTVMEGGHMLPVEQVSEVASWLSARIGV
ncbi:MAG: alpha/beta hydrolase [Pseudomonadota bacterium]